MSRLRRAVALLTTLLAACGGESVSGSSGHGGSAGVEGACRTYLEARLRQGARCRPDSLPGSIDEDQLDSCVRMSSLPGTSRTAARLESCAAQVSEAPCGTAPSCVLDLSPGRGPAGTLPDGAPCQDPAQCASATCSSWLYSAPTGCGVCQEVRAEGQPCGAPEQACAPGLTCRQGVCDWPGQGLGGKCSSYGTGNCPDGLHCASPPDSTVGTCQRRVLLGGECGASLSPCVEGLVCTQGVCAGRLPDGATCDEHSFCVNTCRDGVCRAPRRDAQAGEDCSFDLCAPGLACGTDDTCQVRPPPVIVGEGEDCALASCAEGLVCSRGYLPGSTPGLCVRAPVIGGPCVDLECGPLGWCSDGDLGAGEPGHCIALGQSGQPCPCLGGLFCHEDTCRPYGSLSCP
ncbi:MAG: hypothetical protein EOO75_00270 [Myxococcales bacterium]|nr:MAG: hypothetical protein EOO75_00270 [Myxococcales bacterium]